MTRRKANKPNGHAAPYEGADGWWYCYVTIGQKPNGRPERKQVRRRTQKACAEEVVRIRHQLAAGERVVSKAPTVAEWLDHWLETVVKPNRAYKTYEAYRSIVDIHLKPRIGTWRIGGTRKLLEPEHLDACYADLKQAGMAPSYVLQCHRVLSRALKVAVRRSRANRNVCDLLDAPSARRRKPKPLSMEATKKVIAAIGDDRMAARWLLALLLGLRQGEVLGLRWRNLDLDSDHPTLRPEKQSQRRTWEHGCSDPAACAAQHCRTKPCPPAWEHGCGGCGMRNPRFCPDRQQRACRRHRGKDGCPPPCQPECTKHAATCPQRTGGGMVLVDLKTEKSENTRPLDPMLVAALKEHRRRQLGERMARGAGRPTEDDLVFVSELGKPIDPRRDHERWEQLLERAGVPDAALHAARHTAATLLIATGADASVVQEVLGHTDIRTSRGYIDVAADLKREAVERMASVLFGDAFNPLVQQPGATGAPRR